MGPPLVCRATTGDVRSRRSGPGDEERPGAERTGRRTGRVPGWARATTRSSNRPPARVARNSGTFDRTRTCDDQRSWGEQRQEYTPRGPSRRRPPDRWATWTTPVLRFRAVDGLQAHETADLAPRLPPGRRTAPPQEGRRRPA